MIRRVVWVSNCPENLRTNDLIEVRERSML